MDSVRFGRAVGVGVREVAKAAVKAAEAAQSSTPTPAQARPRAAEPARPRTITPQAIHQGSRRFGQTVWSPFARLSTVLWHEIIGVLFGLFTLVTGLEAWHGRAALTSPASQQPTRPHEIFALAMFLIFSLFTASAFRRASVRQNRK